MAPPPTPPQAAAAAASAVEPPREREFFIDWLRIIALGLLILYHVGMAYVGWPWHVKSAVTGPEVAAAVEPWMRLTSPWRMTLLFVVSGLATALMLSRRGAAPGWLRGRARRLLLPLLTGVLVIVPPQAWLEVRQFHGYQGGYLDFLRLYFSAYGGFCTPGRGCLILPTWNHLWFLPYLFVYTAVLALVLRRWPHALEHGARRLPRWLAGVGLLAWPVAWLALTRLTLRPLFGETHALVDDPFVHAQFAPAFALGVLLASAPQTSSLWAGIESRRHLALAVALGAWVLLVTTPAGAAWLSLPWSVMQWCAVVAALGYARRHLQRDGPLRRYLSEAVFPVYLLHQTVIVIGVAALARWPLVAGAAAETVLLVALTFGISLLGHELARRVGLLRPWMGLGPVNVPQVQGVEKRAIEPRVST